MIEQRIKSLSPQQRQLLAQKINARSAAKTTSECSRPQLVAWFTADGSADVTDAELRSHVSDRLATSVIPRRFVQVDDFPRTNTGKIDRTAVTQIRSMEKPIPSPERVAISPMRESLHRIWIEVLSIPDISPDDNFFQIGGDSLDVIKLVALCQETGLSVTPGMLHTHPTIAELADVLAVPQQSNTSAKRNVIDGPKQTSSANPSADSLDKQYWNRVEEALQVRKPINPVRLSAYADKPCLFLIPPKGHYFDNFRYLAAEITNYTCYSPYSPQEDIVEHRTVEEMVPQFLGQIRRQQPSGPYRIAGNCEGAYLSWSIAIELMDAGERVEFLGILDTPNPSGLKPKHEPFLHRMKRRFGLIRRGPIWGIGWRLGVKGIDWVSRRVRQAFTKELHLTRIGTRMAWLYRPQSYAGHATLFRIIKKNHDAIFETDITHGWGEVADGGFDIYSIPGSRVEAFTEDHFLSPEHSKVLAQRIQSAIASTVILDDTTSP